jgi:hypothetical protein
VTDKVTLAHLVVLPLMLKERLPEIITAFDDVAVQPLASVTVTV